MVRTISFADAKRARLKKPAEYVFHVAPEELGLDPEVLPKEADKDGKLTVAPSAVPLRFRAFTREEQAKTFEKIKDFDGSEWTYERDIEFAMLCLVEPKVPDSADGRAFLEGWAHGTLANFREALFQRSGFRPYVTENASDALKNSVTVTPDAPSISS